LIGGDITPLIDHLKKTLLLSVAEQNLIAFAHVSAIATERANAKDVGTVHARFDLCVDHCCRTRVPVHAGIGKLGC
jgi:hypothetical protein